MKTGWLCRVFGHRYVVRKNVEPSYDRCVCKRCDEPHFWDHGWSRNDDVEGEPAPILEGRPRPKPER